MRLMLAFILAVVAGTMWETSRARRERPLPLLLLCTFLAAVFFSLSRFI